MSLVVELWRDVMDRADRNFVDALEKPRRLTNLLMRLYIMATNTDFLTLVACLHYLRFFLSALQVPLLHLKGPDRSLQI